MGLDKGSVVLLSVLLRLQCQGRSGVSRRSTLLRQGFGIYMAYVEVPEVPPCREDKYGLAKDAQYMGHWWLQSLLYYGICKLVPCKFSVAC